ncbi:MAG: DUF6577 family protein [Bacteroidota bacterium]
MPSTIDIEQLKATFSDQPYISLDELVEYFREENPNMPRSTAKWRVYDLKKRGLLHKIGRGQYAVSLQKKKWDPLLNDELKSLGRSIKERFPYINLSLWSTGWLHPFMHHIPQQTLYIVESEKDTEESVFHFIQENKNKISCYLKPTSDDIDNYISQHQKAIIVDRLITQSPLIEKDGLPVPTLEKILVDILVNPVLFSAFSGKERDRLFDNLLHTFYIDSNRLTRYSKRRNAQGKVDRSINLAKYDH